MTHVDRLLKDMAYSMLVAQTMFEDAPVFWWPFLIVYAILLLPFVVAFFVVRAYVRRKRNKYTKYY